ncbi:MRC1-like domain-containing protein [Desarmillaria tabescens]|uniref:MRC1-like domain-containing protein n=1 Tax=Armillaria tabescens TaxID=1929756 RepID=A0AA39NM18_ARMTA|nr:MRC1-like domain-containing protein [Desarmillaria tabescens]KAK0467989.1 MRC1-like domain-containing protein [Desarmillaria tabescens]
MPISHDSSFVADSTATSSPAPPPPKPTRTYGRQRLDIPSSSSRYEVLKTGLNNGEEVPASSDGEQELDHVVKDAATGSFRFAFQDELAALDADSDGDGEEEKTLLGVETCSENGNKSPVSTCPAKTPTGILEDSLTDLAISSQTELPHKLSTSSLLRAKPRRVHRVDSDSEPESESIQSTSSPVKRARHSSTPPTSDDELPTADQIRKVRVTKRVVEEQSVYPQYSKHKSKPTAGESKNRVKTKAPTKKERKETALNGARIAADRDTSIAQKQSEWNVSRLLKTLQPRREPSSDPIQPFSSPQVIPEASTAPISAPPPAYDEVKSNVPVPTVMDSDDEMPEVGDLRKKEAQSPRKILAEKKMKILALQAQQSRGAQESDEDDDLVIAAPDTPLIQRTVGMQGPSGAKKTHSSLAGISLGSGSKQREAHHASSDIRAQKVAAEVKQAKEQDWQRHGGTLREAVTVHAPAAEVLDQYIQQGLEHVNAEEVGDEDEEEEEDPDYVPLDRGSASPPPPKASDDNDEEDEEPAEDEDITMVEHDVDTETEDVDDRFVVRPRGQRVLRVVEDDDSDAKNMPLGRVLVEDSMIIDDENTPAAQADSHFSFDEQSDKENNVELMYDMDDDKENATVFPRSAQRPAFSRSLFRQESRSDDGLSEADKGESVPRLPLSTLEEDKGTPGRQSFTDRLQSTGSPEYDDCMPPPSLRPEFGPSTTGDLGFSQFSQAQTATSTLQPGFSDLYADSTQKQSFGGPQSDDGFTELFGGKGGFGLSKMRNTDSTDFGLTQDVSLGPAFQVSDSAKLKEADAIFEKEQEYVLQEAIQVPQKQSDLYVNSDGYLTQTRPDTSPEVYRPLSRLTQMQTQPETPAIPYTQQSQRQALGTLEYTPDLTPSLPSPSRKRRIVKRAISRSPTYGASRSGSSKPQEPKSSKHKVPLKKSEFVEAEAQESDDDEMRGFGLFKGVGDDEEEGQDLDRELPTLVDNTALDEEIIAEEKVREKYQEQAEQDDLRLQKYHQDAVEGKYRTKKRRNGVDLDDSDSDDDDDAADERRRRRMNKKQRTDMVALESNPTTAAFAGEYKKTIGDDEDTVMLHSELTEEPDTAKAEEAVGDEDEDDEAQESITRAEIVRQVQERAQYGEFDDDEPFDPHNTDWLDAGSDDDEGVKVRSTTARRTAQGPRRHYEEYDEASEPQHKSTIEYNNRLKDWAKTESRSGRLGKMSRSVGSAAITGHTKVKAGGGSLRQNASGQSSSSRRMEERPRPLKPVPSVLSGVDRSSKFG